MTRIVLPIALVSFGVLAACAPETPAIETIQSGGEVSNDAAAPTGEPAIPEQCDAEDYRPLIGTPIAAATLPAGPMLRAYGETDIITQDYRPQRTNIVYDGDGVILRVTCG